MATISELVSRVSFETAHGNQPRFKLIPSFPDVPGDSWTVLILRKSPDDNLHVELLRVKPGILGDRETIFRSETQSLLDSQRGPKALKHMPPHYVSVLASTEAWRIYRQAHLNGQRPVLENPKL